MSNKNMDMIRTAIEPTINKLGYYLVDVEYKTISREWHLVITIDKDGGVNINDCERVHKVVDTMLDDIDFTNGSPYHLDISSYGLDRNLTNDYDFNKFKGKEVVFKFYKPHMGKKLVNAILIDYDNNCMTISIDSIIHKINRNEIASISQVINF